MGVIIRKPNDAVIIKVGEGQTYAAHLKVLRGASDVNKTGVNVRNVKKTRREIS